ncbi:hypothetical protein AKJ65_01570 [candidate division MSBL1 archaeon SCGC-AAA259E19]|uniref:Uncharacterized protein n=1 Tax=candidate division MSBL1 archaeon SCGC-AAA259E19 TaxID=1698264 RepID=A0A133UN12_9EURY|nr:hypothetical protein AKJ65_01570 [candidate division MSBL1 archaeon SCGC-AAA259E19]
MRDHEIGVKKGYFLTNRDGKKGLRNYYAENMEPHLSINIRNGIPWNNDDTVEEFRDEVKKWKEKWTEERMEWRALERKVEDLQTNK